MAAIGRTEGAYGELLDADLRGFFGENCKMRSTGAALCCIVCYCNPELEDLWRDLLRTVMVEALRFAYVPAYLVAVERMYTARVDRSLHLARTPLLQDVGDGGDWILPMVLR